MAGDCIPDSSFRYFLEDWMTEASFDFSEILFDLDLDLDLDFDLDFFDLFDFLDFLEFFLSFDFFGDYFCDF